MAALSTGNFEELNFETREVSYGWRINDFATNQPHMKKTVNSQPFPGEDLPQWYLQLEPRGNVTQTRDTGVYLVLKKAEKGQKSIVVDFNLQILDDNDKVMMVQTVSGQKLTEGGSGLGFYIEKDSDDKIPLSALGHLIIRVNIFIRKPVRTDLFHSPIDIPKSSITADWMKLLKTDDYADFMVESADGQTFPVQRGILAVRNPQFFATMFKTPMKEVVVNRVKLPFDAEIVSALLEYVYTDNVANLTPIAARLYQAAHQYQLDRLVVVCAANLSQNLTVANISVAVHIAEVYEDFKLLSACQKFGSKPSGSKPSGFDRIRKWFKGAQ